MIQSRPIRPFGFAAPDKGLPIIRAALPEGSALRGGVMVLGNFDGFHRGHLYLIRAAKRIAADGRAVGVMSVEPHPRQLFRPADAPFRLASVAQKHHQAAAIGLDFLYEPAFDAAFAIMQPIEFIHDILGATLGVSHIVVGADFHFGAKRAGNAATLGAECPPRGIGVTVLPLQAGYSSTAVRAAVEAGEIAQARNLLGRPWQAEVARGLCLARAQIRPPAGRYLIRAAALSPALLIDLDDEGRISGPQNLPARIDFLERRSSPFAYRSQP